MDFLKLFVVALMPVLKVLLITAFGTFLTLKRFNILGDIASKNMNTMIFFVFAPALVCSSLAKTITLRSVIVLWFMPVNILLSVIIGTALGWLLVKITRVSHHLQGLVLGCCSVGNLGNFPLIIVPAICEERSNPFGDMNVCHTNGLAYASLSLAVGAIVVWCFGYNFFRIYSQNNSNVVKVDESTINSASATQIDAENHGSVAADEDESQTKNRANQLEIELTVPDGQAKIVGIIIGIVPQFRKLLIGKSAPLHVVQDCLIMLGDVTIPTMTMLIGANLLKGLKGQGVKASLVVGIIVVRYIALPAIGIGIVKSAAHFGLIHHDPLYQFILLLQFTLPPAVSISTFSQLFEVGEGECSVIMLATYSCAVVSLTLWCTFFMWLVQ
ncbi:protein PIN-LIKES 1-like [Abrus precatorius]|uniref:Protein PIN-LIKES 1-like n=1 Tax=Abrus precatorius TaxID=3816 RepID=A0A8B8K115_ABRPR|nr:protein PIN-LIKES 1-like [Abrus precatorius]